MNKKILFFLIFIGFVLIYEQVNKKQKKPFVYLSPQDQILEEKEIPQKNDGISLVAHLNQQLTKIHSVYDKNCIIYFKQGNSPTFRVFGELAIEKEKNFRLVISHRLTGKEMDLGSNDKVFWFWNKRMNPPVLHFSTHVNLHKTNLKTVLNPIWLMESFGIFPIDFKDAEISKYKDSWFVKTTKISSSGQKVKYVILINPVSKNIIGRYLYNEKNQLFASSEYQEFDGSLARKITFIWYDENINLEINLNSYQINKGIDPKYWSMPLSESAIDIGN